MSKLHALLHADNADACIAGTLEGTLRSGCTELLSMNQSDALDSTATLCSLRGGLTRNLNPFLSLLESIANVSPLTVESALHKTVDQKVLLKKWILSTAIQPMADGFAVDGASIVKASWKVHFCGFSEWNAMFQFMLEVSRSVPFLVFEFQVLSHESMFQDFDGDLAVLERDHVTKAYICTMPVCLFSDLSKADDKWNCRNGHHRVPTLERICKLQRNWWMWLNSLWNPIITRVYLDHMDFCGSILRTLWQDGAEFTGATYQQAGDLHNILSHPCIGSQCPFRASIICRDTRNMVINNFVPGASAVRRHCKILENLFSFVDDRTDIHVCCAPWSVPFPSLRLDRSDTIPETFVIVPELSLPLLLSDSEDILNVKAVLRMFHLIISEDVSDQSINCIHATQRRLSVVKCLFHSALSKWLTAFLRLYIMKLTSAACVNNSKRKLGEDAPRVVEIVDDNPGELKLLHQVISFAFHQPNWFRLVVEDCFAVDVEVSAVYRLLQLWVEKGLHEVVQLILFEGSEVESWMHHACYPNLHLALSLITTVIFSGLEDQNCCPGVFIEKLLEMRSRNDGPNDPNCKRVCLFLEELIELIDISVSLFNLNGLNSDAAVSKSNHKAAEIKQDQVLSDTGQSVLFSLQRAVSLVESSKNCSWLTNQSPEAYQVQIWNRIKGHVIFRR